VRADGETFNHEGTKLTKECTKKVFSGAPGPSKFVLLHALIRELRAFVVNFPLKFGAQRGLLGKQPIPGSHQ
jgi:hypothetical protein